MATKTNLDRKVQIEVTVRNIILSLADFGMIFIRATDKGKFYRKAITDYQRWRESDRIAFPQRIYYLRRKKLIRTFFKGKKRYIELTSKGKRKAREYFFRNIKIKRRKKWDGKWRIVIFDIPESRREKRDLIRPWLKNLGLVEIQKSVYIYPFEFKKELDLMVGELVVYRYVKYMISDIIQGEKLIIKKFLEEKILTTDDLEKE